MWWNDIKEIRVTLDILTDRVVRVEQTVEKLLGHVQENAEICLKHEEVEDLLIYLRDSFCPTDECSAINRIQENLKTLIEDTDRKEDVRLSMKILDKFEDYMKNVDKLNLIVNELKGCTSMARAALEERKQFDNKTKKDT